MRNDHRTLHVVPHAGRRTMYPHIEAPIAMAQKAVQDHSTVFVIDDDIAVCTGISDLLESVGFTVKTFRSSGDFLQAERPNIPSCLLLDVRLPGMSGLDFQSELAKLDIHLPIVFMTGYADVPMGVQAIKAGAIEFLCKPFRDQDLLDAVIKSIGLDRKRRQGDESFSTLKASYETLTPREREVMAHVVSGLMNKQIAAKLGISDITVKVHRASIIRKMQAKSLAALVRMADTLEARKSLPSFSNLTSAK